MVGEIVSRSSARDIISSAIINLNHLFELNQKGQITILPVFANSKGAERLGLFPQLSDVLVAKLKSIWGEYPEATPRNTDAMTALIKKEEIKGMFIVGANPMMLYPDREFVKESLEKLDFLVVCDLFETETTELADVVLPLASWAEYDGFYINLEGRVQKAEKAIKPLYEAKAGYEIINMIAQRFNTSLFADENRMNEEILKVLECDTSRPFDNEFYEVKLSALEKDDNYPIPLFMVDDPHHRRHLTEKSSALSNFVSEAYLEMSPHLASRYNIEAGDSVRVESKVGKIIVPAKISDYLDNDAVLIPRNFSSTTVNALLMRKRRIDWVKITKVKE